MLSQLTDERVLYRVRRTVLQMLRDRGYEIGDAELEESYEEFEKRYMAKPQLNLVAKRPVQQGSDAMDTGAPMMEPIYVVFANKDDKLSKDAILKVVGFMDAYSKNNDDPHTQELLNAILIVKGGLTPIAKKVSFGFLTPVEHRAIRAICDRDVHAGGAACQHHQPRAGAQALGTCRLREERAPQEVPRQGEPAAEDLVRGPSGSLFRREAWPGSEDCAPLGDSRSLRDLQDCRLSRVN